MAQEHQRCVISMDKLVDFWQKRNHALADEAAKVLEDREEEYKTAVAELEAKKKKTKPKKGEPEVEINHDEYKKLPRELLQRMLEKRLAEEDCNAGAIFDNLKSDLWEGEKFAIELIADAAGA